jgi:hypothetical protein
LYCWIFFVLDPDLNRFEGDPYLQFIEVPVNETANISVIHLVDKDIMNIPGVDVRQKNGKISSIDFRSSDLPPRFSIEEFSQKYSGSDLPSARKYLEYKGVYYYSVFFRYG